MDTDVIQASAMANLNLTADKSQAKNVKNVSTKQHIF